MKAWHAAVMLVLLLVGSAAAAAADAASAGDAVDAYIKAEMAKQQIPGLSLAVIWNGEPIKVKAFGMADVDRKTPVTLDTAYDVGSVAKPFTAAAVLTLADRGKFRLDDPISRFFANDPAQWRGITVWNLLTNTSGIKDYTSEIPSSTKIDYTDDLVYLRSVGAGLNFPPGSQFRYSQTNYVLLGLIIQASTGRPFSEYIASQILEPLEMTHTVPYSAKSTPADLARGYRLVDGKPAPVDREKRAFADAFFSTTITDMVKWAVALDKGSIFTDSDRSLMWTAAPLISPAAQVRRVPTPRGQPPGTPIPSSAPRRAPYGAGWYVEALNGHRVIGHGGSVGGFSANLTRFPDDKLTVIILTNMRDVNVFPLVRGVASKYAPALK
ncbi:MAG TPA: serine hydrolase domain-containing protein [Chthonomonadaceae bacterium]|nr:serine hydrolase domain-containing protein [Chthonomonadaceae bacterium]